MLLYDNYKVGAIHSNRQRLVTFGSTGKRAAISLLPWEDLKMKNNVQSPAYMISWKSAEGAGLAPETESVSKFRSELYAEILRCAQHYSQKELQSIFDEPQPRVSELLHGRIAGKSVEKLMYYASRLGIEIRPTFERRKLSWKTNSAYPKARTSKRAPPSTNSRSQKTYIPIPPGSSKLLSSDGESQTEEWPWAKTRILRRR
jgi:predicted XRE-type DNA-binding protein